MRQGPNRPIDTRRSPKTSGSHPIGCLVTSPGLEQKGTLSYLLRTRGGRAGQVERCNGALGWWSVTHQLRCRQAVRANLGPERGARIAPLAIWQLRSAPANYPAVTLNRKGLSDRVLSPFLLVEPTGIEPVTSTMPSDSVPLQTRALSRNLVAYHRILSH
jgi:hypothetical protein